MKPRSPHEEHAPTTEAPQATDVEYRFGTSAECADARCGELSRFVIDPTGPRITHLVIEPHHHHALARLVPFERTSVDDRGIRLGCSRVEYETFEPAEEIDVLPSEQPTGYAPTGMFGPVLLPYSSPVQTFIVHESIPDGGIELTRSARVRFGHIRFCHLHGLIANPTTGRVTEAIVGLGHFRHAREMRLAIGSDAEIGQQGLRLTLDRSELAALLSSGRIPPR